MYPDRGIVRTYRLSDGLSTRPDDQNTLTRQSVDKINGPRDPRHVPVTDVWLELNQYIDDKNWNIH